MKRLITIVMVLASFMACNKDEVLTENNQESQIQKEYGVIDGVLCFKNLNSLEILKKELAGKDYSELAIWEDKIGFSSIEKAKSDLMDEIDCRANGFVSNGYSPKEVIEKFNNGELEELTDQMRTEIDRLKLIYDKDNDGIRMMKYDILCHYPNRFMNEDYKIVIADTLYQFSKEQIEITPGFNSSTKVEPIIASRQFRKSNLKSTGLSSNIMCYDVYNDGDHLLTADLIVERNNFQLSGCTSDCMRSTFEVYIDYHGYYKSLFNWHEGSYNVNYATAYDISWNYQGTESGPFSYYPSGSASSSPISLYYLNGLYRDDYPWIGIGNINCGSVDMGSGIVCYWSQDYGCWGNQREGYCSTYKFYN